MSAHKGWRRHTTKEGATSAHAHKWRRIIRGREEGSSSTAVTSIDWCEECGAIHKHVSYLSIMQFHNETLTPSGTNLAADRTS
jgi:hypothetical protein